MEGGKSFRIFTIPTTYGTEQVFIRPHQREQKNIRENVAYITIPLALESVYEQMIDKLPGRWPYTTGLWDNAFSNAIAERAQPEGSHPTCLIPLATPSRIHSLILASPMKSLARVIKRSPYTLYCISSASATVLIVLAASLQTTL